MRRSRRKADDPATQRGGPRRGAPLDPRIGEELMIILDHTDSTSAERNLVADGGAVVG